MNLSHCTPAEIERIAYVSGQTLAAEGWGAFADIEGDVEALESDIDNALDLVGCSGKRGKDLYATLHDIGQAPNTIEVMESALQTIAAAMLMPGKVDKRHLVELSKIVLDIVATPDDFSQSSARKAVYKALGHEV